MLRNTTKHFLIAAVCILLFSCEKEDESQATCKTCNTEMLYQAQNQQSQTYLQSSTKYCNGEWESLNGKVVKRSGTNNNGWWKETTTTTCQ